MSYILDALNKSEEEKRQHRTPGLNTIHQATDSQASNRGPMILVIASLLLINLLALLIWWLFFSGAPETANTESVSHQGEAAMPSTRIRTNKQNQSSAPRQNQPINAEVATRRAGQSRQGLAPSLRQESRDNGALPRVIAQDIAAIRFSSHIFADDASLRRVVINGQPLKEGNRFGNGLVLRNITDEGVILEYQGQTVSISVLSQWADD